MKKYESLGALLIDYRKVNNMSQADFAANINVDTRTVQRWEKNETLVKSEKENEIAIETLLPYQLIRNLNASIVIPTFYDFRIRKYSLSELSTELPNASWFKERMNDFTERIRPIELESDIEYIMRDMQSHKHTPSLVSKALIREAVKLLPELNLIITDDSGYYSGHSIVFPINSITFERLKNREISEEQITIENLVNYKTQAHPIFYNYDTTADCNDNIFHLAHYYFNFFSDLPTDNYDFCSFTIRYDSYLLNEQLGLEIVWEDKKKQNKLGLEAPPRFYKGNFNAFLFE